MVANPLPGTARSERLRTELRAQGGGRATKQGGASRYGVGVRWLIVYANPDTSSFSATLRDEALASLTAAGHEVEVIDLHADGFDPSLSAFEHEHYFELAADHPDPLIADHVTKLRWAEGLVFIFPTWWTTMPAVLKGWLERVFLPDVAFTLHPRTRRVTPALTNIRRLVGVTSSGGPYWRVRLAGHSGRTIIGRTVRLVCARHTRLTWLAMGDADTAGARERDAFVNRVGDTLAGLS